MREAWCHSRLYPKYTGLEKEVQRGTHLVPLLGAIVATLRFLSKVWWVMATITIIMMDVRRRTSPEFVDLAIRLINPRFVRERRLKQSRVHSCTFSSRSYNLCPLRKGINVIERGRALQIDWDDRFMWLGLRIPHPLLYIWYKTSLYCTSNL